MEIVGKIIKIFQHVHPFLMYFVYAWALAFQTLLWWWVFWSHTFSSIRLNVDRILQDNNISGQLPVEIGNLTKLLLLDLSNNSFEGPIPSTFANLKSINNLQLKLNHLSGPFPTFLSTIPTLTTLYALLFHLTSPRIVVAFCIQWRSSSFKIKIKVHWSSSFSFFSFFGVFLLFHLLKLADILNKQSVMNSFFAKMNWLENALPRQQQ
jgi:hypothetical protein